jgi:hypothetical protein
MAAVPLNPNTFIWFPNSMRRIAQTAIEEIGGLLIFKRVKEEERVARGIPVPKVLRLNRAEFVAGSPLDVNPADLISEHYPDEQWILFHTHPSSAPGNYMGLSGGDIEWILMYALTAPGDVPSVSHVLLAENYVHYSIVREKPYKAIRKLLAQYRVKRKLEGGADPQIISEFMGGIRFFTQMAEAYIRREGRNDDILSMSRLDCIWFAPDDSVTNLMIHEWNQDPAKWGVAPALSSKPFVDWFFSQTLRLPNVEALKQMAARDIQLVNGGRKEDVDAKAGLLYSWSTAKDVFLKNGQLGLNDGGYVYDSFVERPSALRRIDQTIMQSLDKAPPKGGSKRVQTFYGGGLVTIPPEMLAKVSAMAEEDMKKQELKDTSGGGLVTIPPEMLAKVSAMAEEDMKKQELNDTTMEEITGGRQKGKKKRTTRRRPLY